MLSFPNQDLRDEINRCLIDTKTHLNNATGMFYLIDNLLKQHQRYEDNWALLTFSVNKEFVSCDLEQISQDEIDKLTASTLKNICRSSDILSFCGDAIFCILTRVFEGDDMVMFAEKILRNLKNLTFNNSRVEINARFGITFSKYKDTTEEFINRSFSSLSKALQTQEKIVVGI